MDNRTTTGHGYDPTEIERFWIDDWLIDPPDGVDPSWVGIVDERKGGIVAYVPNEGAARQWIRRASAGEAVQP